MLPGDGTLTDPSLPDDFIWPMRVASDPLTDYEMGGDVLGESSGVLTARLWQVSYEEPEVVLTGDASDTRRVLFERAGITELALAFDQTMNPFVAFVEGGQATFWWYDTDANEMTFTDLPADARTPRCCLDERRSVYRSDSDVILAYMRSGSLCYRQQRDRYQTEYTLATGQTGSLASVGMTTSLRLQFKIRPDDYT